MGLAADVFRARHDVSARYNPLMYRSAIVILLVIFAGLQYRLWVGDGSWAQVHRLTQMRDNLHNRNIRNQSRNDAMQAEVNDLKSGEQATEGRARADMGMIKRDEKFFLTVTHPDGSAETD